MKIGTAESKTGEITYGVITVGYTMGRFPIEIPIVIVEGVEDGPTLAVSGAVHGGELLGPMGIHEFLHNIDPKEVKGRIVIVPVANPGSFEFGMRSTPWDEMNLNRVGLGKADGGVTEQIAYHFANEVVLQADALVDIHSGTADGFVFYTIYRAETEDADPQVIEMSKKMAVAYGLQEIMGATPTRWAGGYMMDILRSGVPAITVEIGGGGDYFINGKQQIEMCAQGIKNVAILMGMMEGEIITELDEVTFWRGEAEIIAGAKGGLMRTDVQIGDFCPAGSVWGVLYNPYTGKEVERLITPIDCYQLASLHPWPAVRPGSALSVLGNKMGDGTVKVKSILTDVPVRTGEAYKTRRD